MQYLYLIYSEEKNSPKPKTREEGDAMMAPWLAYNKELTDAGVLVAGEALQPTSTATTVAARNGDPVFTDGPFAETKEQLGGFYMVECKDLDDAMKWAAKCPGTAYGRVEVRPVMDLSKS